MESVVERCTSDARLSSAFEPLEIVRTNRGDLETYKVTSLFPNETEIDTCVSRRQALVAALSGLSILEVHSLDKLVALLGLFFKKGVTLFQKQNDDARRVSLPRSISERRRARRRSIILPQTEETDVRLLAP